MIRVGAGTWVVLACFGGAAVARAQAIRTPSSPPRVVRVGDLIGLTPRESQVALAPEAAGRPVNVSLEWGPAADRWAVIQARDMLQDATAVEAAARFRQHAAFSSASVSACRLGTSAGQPAPFTLLAFHNGRLTSVWDGVPGRSADPTGLSADDLLSRAGRTRLDAAETRVVSCETIGPGPARPGVAAPDAAGDLQGLALLPFAVGLPSLNARRSAVMREGAATYARLEPGLPAPVGLPRVRRFSDAPEPGSELLLIDLGAYPGRNLSDFDDHAVVEIRRGVVAWRALDWTGAGLTPRPPTSTTRKSGSP